MRYLSEGDLQKLLSCVHEKADAARRRGAMRAVVDEVLVLLLVNTGLRPAELCNLTIADLVTEHARNTIRVRDARGSVSRAVEVTREMAEYLRRFIKLHRRQARPNDPLLVNERGARFTYMSLYNKVKRIGRDAKIENLHPRILRSTYVVRLYNSEQDLRFVQQQAGHTSLRTTALYAIAAGGHLPVVAPDRADPEAIERTGYSRIQGMTEERAAERATSHRETVPVKDLQQTERCEVCGRPIGARGGTRIDSGQILCPDCLKELRSI